MGGERGNENRLSGWAVLVIAVACAAYWLARSGVLGTTWAVTAGIVAAGAVLAVRGTVRGRARRREKERREMLARLAGDLRRAADGQRV